MDWGNVREVARARWSVDGPRSLTRTGLHLGLSAVHELLWALDRDAPPPPSTLLLVGHQRSGTTWLHRMLCRHPAAAGLSLIEQLLPSDRLGRLHRHRPRIDPLQDRLFGSLDDLHRIRLHEVEEDEFVLWAGTRGAMNAHDRPWPPGAAPRIDIDGSGLDYYAQVVARAVRRTGRRHVGKSPQLGRFVPALRARFPGLRVVQLVRDPARAIPSRMSLVQAIWRRRVPGFTHLEPHHVEALLASSRAILLGPLGQADVVIHYDDLVADPVATVRALHAHLDLEPWPEPLLAELAATPRTGRTPHRYALQDFGLDEDDLHRELAPFYEAFPAR